MISLGSITQRADSDGVDTDTVERDYVLTHVMETLSLHDQADLFQFKGGTLLRLCYFEGYRYSADIDLNLDTQTPFEEALDIMSEVLATTRGEVDLPHLELADRRGQTVIEFVGPKRAKPRWIKLDIASDECILDPDHRIPLLARYEDQGEALSLRGYALTEVIAEKFRCLMQRSQCRDLYDIWYLLEEARVDITDVKADFHAKARHRGLDPAVFREHLERRLGSYAKRWDDELGAYLDPVPDLSRVERTVKRKLRSMGIL